MKKFRKMSDKIQLYSIVAYTAIIMNPVGALAVDLFNTTLNESGVQIPGSDEPGGVTSTFNTMIDVAREFVSGVMGIISVVLVGLFAVKMFQFMKDSGNANARAQHIQGIISFAIGAACFGAASLFTGLFYNAIRGSL